MTEVRHRVRDHVRSHPGVHFRAIVRELELGTGQAQYHLRELGRAGDVVSEEVRDRRHYFDPGYDAWERRALALCRRETTRAIVVALLDEERLRAVALVDRLGVARSTVSWHVSSLTDAGVVEKSYDDGGAVQLRLTRPAATRRLLDEVSPSLSDRLVDRFTCLVDDALPGDPPADPEE